MLDFCPYDFKKIDLNNLAYELVFAGTWTWERVQNETVVGTDRKRYIVVNDEKKFKHFKKDTKVGNVMLIEHNGRNKGAKNGLQRFIEDIENENARLDNKNADFSEDAFDVDNDGYEKNIDSERSHYFDDDFSNGDEKIRLFHEVQNGLHTFVDEDEDIIMYAMPCCPKCRNRLPIGFSEAQDFCAVSLMAPSGRGKTTFLLSMMNNDWIALKNLGNPLLNITSGHLLNDETDILYYNMTLEAEKMCQTEGVCPNNTDRDFWIPPVFLKVQYNGHTMILGIYDNAGENLSLLNPFAKPQMKMLLDKMFGVIFLFDPKDLNIALPSQKKTQIAQVFEKCELLSLEKQGIYQKQNRGVTVTASELLQRVFGTVSEKHDIKKALEVYRSYKAVLQQNNGIDRLKEMYFSGVLIKSDLLEQVEEIKSFDNYWQLFDRSNPTDLFDQNAMDMRMELIQTIIKELRLFGDFDIDEFKYDFGELEGEGKFTGKRAVSWHCVSALGCDADSFADGGKLHGDYKPIRLAEPLVTCILKRIVENGWVK